MNDPALEQLCEVAKSLYERGYAHGSTGNISVRTGDEVWITPTGHSLRALAPERLARVGLGGDSLNENKPSKEHPFHTAIYRCRPEARAIVHHGWTLEQALDALETRAGRELDWLAPIA